MMTKIQLSKNNKYQLLKLLPVFVIIFIAIAVSVIISCTNCKTPHYNIIELNGNGGFFNYSKSSIGYSVKSDSVHSTALLADIGDLLAFDNFIYSYQDAKETKLRFKTNNGSLSFCNEKLFAIGISEHFDLLPWFRQMKLSDISDLQLLAVSSAIPDSYYPYLKTIGKERPNIGLFIDNETTDLLKLLKIFSPRLLICTGSPQTDFNVLTGLKNIELLGISLNDSTIAKPLPSLPGLKQLILMDCKEGLKINNDFLKNNKQIEQLIIQQSDYVDLSMLQPLDNLKKLSITLCKEVKNANVLKSFKRLEVLCLAGDTLENIMLINDLTHLRWLSLPYNTCQKDFNSIIEHHPNIEVLELVKCNYVKSLKPLLQLHNLYGLVVSDTVQYSATLQSLKQLKYLSIPEKEYSDSIKTASLRISLPGCTIVSNEGFCLGSGWLLLLIPFIILFRVCMRQKQIKDFK